MAENPIAIRVNEEVKALFNELAEQGQFENKGEFLNRLLVIYQAETMKSEVSIMKPAIETVETLTSRLLEVLNGTAAVISTKEEKYNLELEEQKKSFDETRMLLQQRISSLEQEEIEKEERIGFLIEEKEALKDKANELTQQIKQLEDSSNDKNALIDEYKNKNDTLNSILSEYKASADENKNLTKAINELERSDEQKQRRIDELTDEINRKADMFKSEIETIKKSLVIENEMALLELKKLHQIEIQEQQEKYTTSIKDYENKVRELLDFRGQNK